MKKQKINWRESECRQAVLRALARGFTYPDTHWVESLLSGSWLRALEEVASPLGLATAGLAEAIAALPAQKDLALQELQIEYTYLFINAIPHVPAPPYASAYTNLGSLMGKAAEEALQAYHTLGLSLSEDFHDLPDHLAVELEFLSWLEGKELEAKEQREPHKEEIFKREKEAFWVQQLKPWLPEFLRRVKEAARIPFYRELAILTKIFMQNIQEIKN